MIIPVFQNAESLIKLHERIVSTISQIEINKKELKFDAKNIYTFKASLNLCKLLRQN